MNYLIFDSHKEEHWMNISGKDRDADILKIIALGFAFMIMTSSVSVTNLLINYQSIENSEISTERGYQTRLCEVKTILADEGTWISLDGDTSDAGTETHAFVTVSDTTGLTIVADFYGFWRDTINDSVTGILFDMLDMPGGSNIFETGKPMTPMLITHVEIPHDINITLEVIQANPTSIPGYYLYPAQLPTVPIVNYTHASSYLYYDEVYDDDNVDFSPNRVATIVGWDDENPIILRGRRILEVAFFPVQHNPNSGYLNVYSQIIVKIHYEVPSQIEPVDKALRSEQFERMYKSLLLNYDPFDEYFESIDSMDAGIGFAFTQPTDIAYTYPASATSSTLTLAQTASGPAGYLIITHPYFVNAAENLAAWKRQKGILTEIVITKEIPVAQDIKDIILDAYNSWKPDYAVIIGDTEFIPCDYGMVHTARDYGPNGIADDPSNSANNDDILFHGANGRIATDVTYFCVDGTDYLADISYGRISVNTIIEAETIVNKILNYEINPPTEPLFYDRITASAFFQHDPSNLGREDYKFPYMSTSEYIREVLHVDGDYPEDTTSYTIRRRYAVETFMGIPDPLPNQLENSIYLVTLKNSDQFTPTSPSEGDDCWDTANEVSEILEDDLPVGYSISDRLTWKRLARDRFHAQLQAGRFLMWNFDHGDSMNMWWPTPKTEGDYNSGPYGFAVYDGQWAPRYFGYYDGGFQDDVYWLGQEGYSNEDRLPFFLSLDCNCGWFDGEIDQDQEFIDPTTDAYDHLNNLDAHESFAERLTRLPLGGAIAIIASTRVIFNEATAPLLMGMVEAIWPSLFGLSDDPGYELGYILAQGKNKVLNTFGLVGINEGVDDLHYLTETTNQLFHLFGDPETQLWTRQPMEIAITYPAEINTLSQSFVVTVEDDITKNALEGARVCIQDANGLYMVGQTDNRGKVQFSLTPTFGNDIDLTVTFHNYKPKIETIHVIAATPTLTLSIEQGKSGDPIHYTVIGFSGLDDIEITYDGLFPEYINPNVGQLDALVPELSPGFVNIIASQSDSGEVDTKLFFCYLDYPDPYIYSQWDQNTWHLYGQRLTYNNPCIEIYDLSGNFVSSQQLIKDTWYDVHVTVYNDGVGIIEPAKGINVELRFANFGAGVGWTPIGSDTIDISAGSSNTAIIRWKPSYEGHTCIRAEIFLNEDGNMNNNLGQENAEVLLLRSPGEIYFMVGNPNSTEPEYLYIDVRQEGTYSDVWEAEILGFSSQALSQGESENISLYMNSPGGVANGTWRIFTVQVYINGKLVGGVSINATVIAPELCVICIVILIGSSIVAIALIGIYVKKRGRIT